MQTSCKDLVSKRVVRYFIELILKLNGYSSIKYFKHSPISKLNREVKHNNDDSVDKVRIAENSIINMFPEYHTHESKRGKQQAVCILNHML